VKSRAAMQNKNRRTSQKLLKTKNFITNGLKPKGKNFYMNKKD